MSTTKNYPQMPSEMSDASGAGGSGMAAGPPSYEQAVRSEQQQYPPVQVLPTPAFNDLARSPQVHAAATNYASVTTTTQYGGGGGGGPQHQHQRQQYIVQQQQAPQHQPRMPPYPVQQYPVQQQQFTYTMQSGAPGMAQPPIVIIQQPAALPLGPEPAYVTCPACHIKKLTRIEYEPSTRTHLMAALLCILGLWCCVCLPYCAGSCMNMNHYCGNCNKFLGSYGKDL